MIWQQRDVESPLHDLVIVSILKLIQIPKILLHTRINSYI